MSDSIRRGFPLAAIVLAHTDPAMTARLCAALAPTPIFLHLDKRVHAEPWIGRLDPDGETPFRLTRRVRCKLGSWSLVEAELAALSEAFASCDAEHFLVMSGSDYPLASVEAIVAELERWSGLSLVVKSPIPFEFWGSDGGMRRFDRRWVTGNDNVITIGGKHLHYPGRRTVPTALTLYASQEWKILARDHVAHLLRICRERADLVNWWKSTLVPEESMITSVLSSPALVGDTAEAVIHALPWLIEWDARDTEHPRVLTMEDWDLIHRAAKLWPRDDPAEINRPIRFERRRMFGRKFRSGDVALLDRIDAELRT